MIAADSATAQCGLVFRIYAMNFHCEVILKTVCVYMNLLWFLISPLQYFHLHMSFALGMLQQTCVLSHTTDPPAVSHSGRVCHLIQQTCLLCGTTHMSPVRRSRLCVYRSMQERGEERGGASSGRSRRSRPRALSGPTHCGTKVRILFYLPPNL